MQSILSNEKKNNKVIDKALKKVAAIAPAQDPRAVEADLKKSAMLGKTADGKFIYLYFTRIDTPVLLEIGRLRELTFRSVSEGSGKSCDLSDFDYYYDHIVLWDDTEKEIVGSYRLIPCQRALEERPDSPEPMYMYGLFEFSDEFKKTYFPQGVEMGRSFVQPKYWGTRSLDYLWYGIAAYFKKNPELRYFIGSVSISKEYPEIAKNLLVHFYSTQFKPAKQLATAKHPFIVDEELIQEYIRELDKQADYKKRFSTLKKDLSQIGVPVPTLYKQYTEMYEEDGVKFLAFNVTKTFSDVTDGLIVADAHLVKESKKQRYLAGLN